MRAVTWHGKRRRARRHGPRSLDPAADRRDRSRHVERHLRLRPPPYEVMGPFMGEGDILGHEPMGDRRGGGRRGHADRARATASSIPFNISCGHCWMCDQQLYSQCETTQNRESGMGASLFGYTSSTARSRAVRPSSSRVPQAQFGPIKVPEGPPDDRFVYLSDVLPTAWQAVEYAAVPRRRTVVVLGLGPIGDMCTRIAAHRGAPGDRRRPRPRAARARPRRAATRRSTSTATTTSPSTSARSPTGAGRTR